MGDIQADASGVFDLFEALFSTMLGSPDTTERGTLQSRDLTVFAVSAVAMFAFNWGVRLLVIEPYAQWLLKPAPGSPRAGSKKYLLEVQKFGQSAMEAIFYGVFAIIGVVLVPQQPWAWPSSEWWRYDRGDFTMRDDLRCYYIIYCGRYTACGLSVFLEHKRKDFWEMVIHHWVTVVLVALSYAYGWVRVGAAVMVLLDPADVPLHVAKLNKYIADNRSGGLKKWCQWSADRWFEVFAVVFAITRCMMYPYCCWSAALESIRHTELGTDGIVCNVLLDVLLVLQFYWMYLIIAAAIRMAKSGGIEDVRSDDEDDPQKEN